MPFAPDQITIRHAVPQDVATIVEFNQAMAWETEQKKLVPEVILAGVQSLLAHPDRGFYIVTEFEQRVVACLMITFEWSDWRNGLFWWIQSVYVHPDYRRRGLYGRMYGFVKELAVVYEPRVCGFRLYVEQDNVKAQMTYRALGMRQNSYRMFEELVVRRE